MLRSPDERFGDGRVALRLLEPGDADDFLEGLRDPAVHHLAYGDRMPVKRSAVADLITRVPLRLASGDALVMAVVERGAGAFLGITMLFGCDASSTAAEIGFWLMPEARGRGLGTEAIRLTLSWAFDVLGMERINGLTDLANEAGQRSMERAGLRREGVLRGIGLTARGRKDMISYSVLSTD